MCAFKPPLFVKATRDFAAALRYYDEALSIWPDKPYLIAGKASVYQSLGELDQADPLLQKLHPTAKNATPGSTWKFTIKPSYAGRYSDAIGLLKNCLAQAGSAPALMRNHYRVTTGRSRTIVR